MTSEPKGAVRPSALARPGAFVWALALGVMAGAWLPEVGLLKPVGAAFVVLLQGAAPVIVVLSVASTWRELRRGALGVFGARLIGLTALATVSGCLLAAAVGEAARPGGAAVMVAASSRAWSPVSRFGSFFDVSLWREFGALAALVLAVAWGEILTRLDQGGAAAATARWTRVMEAVRERTLNLVLAVAPLGAFALVAVAVGQLALGFAVTAGRAYLVVALAQAAVAAVIGAALLGATPRRPSGSVKGVFDALIGGLATGSSAASFPLEQRAAEALGLPRGPSSVALSLGVALSKVGTGAFLAALCGFAGAPVSPVSVALAAAMAALATPPVSGAGLLMLSFVFQQTGLDPAQAAVLSGLPLIGKLNTPLNALGRLTVTAWALPQEKAEARRAIA